MTRRCLIVRNSNGVREKYSPKIMVWVQRKMRLKLLVRRKEHAYHFLALKLQMCQQKHEGRRERNSHDA